MFFHIKRCYRTFIRFFPPIAAATVTVVAVAAVAIIHRHRHRHVLIAGNAILLVRISVSFIGDKSMAWILHCHISTLNSTELVHTGTHTRADWRTQNDSNSLIIVVIQEHCISSFYSIKRIMTLRQCGAIERTSKIMPYQKYCHPNVEELKSSKWKAHKIVI